MDDDRFKKNYYEPYLETWKIIRLVQYADQTKDSDAQWQRYMKEIDRLDKTYPENPFVQDLIKLLLDAGDCIAKDNGRLQCQNE